MCVYQDFKRVNLSQNKIDVFRVSKEGISFPVVTKAYMLQYAKITETAIHVYTYLFLLIPRLKHQSCSPKTAAQDPQPHQSR
jgi:hypothetical protein